LDFVTIMFLQSKVVIPTDRGALSPYSLFITFYNSQGNDGGILTHLHTKKGRAIPVNKPWRPIGL
jgi:hypothetical protein